MRSSLATLIPCRFIAILLLALLLPLLASAQTAPVVTITPASGEIESALLTIEIVGLAPDSAYRVEFVFGGDVILSSDEISDAAGRIRFPASSTKGDLPGIYRVRVVEDGVVLASADFELTPKANGASLSVSPDRGPIGALHTLAISGLRRESAYIIEITAEATAQRVYRRERISDDGGGITLEVFAQDGDATGTQAIAVYDAAGSLIATGEFHIDAPDPAAPVIEISPQAIAAGQTVAIQVSGLPASASVSAQIKSLAGVLIDAASARASDSGAATLSIATRDDLPPGTYRVEVFIEASKAGEASLMINADSAPAAAAPQQPPPQTAASAIAVASIQPQSAPIGASHRIQVSGLNADEAIEFDVTFAGASVYRARKTADGQGKALLELVTESGDQPGDYRITVIRRSGNQPTVVLTATPATAAADSSESLIQGELEGGSQRVAFAATAGQYLLITLESADFDPAMSLIGRDGMSASQSYGIPGSGKAALGPLKLPESADYELEVYASPTQANASSARGAFTVSIAPVLVTPIADDAPLAFTLSPDEPVHYFGLRANGGDRLNLSVDSRGALDSMLRVIAPDGSEFAFDDDSGSALDAEISSLAIETPGDYALAVSTFDGIATGSGSLALRRNPARALESEALIVTLNDKSIRDLVVFEGAEDELLLLRLDKLAGDVEDLFVTATVDGMEVMSYSTMGVPDELPLPFVLPMAGKVLVTLEKLGVADGISLSVSLERP